MYLFHYSGSAAGTDSGSGSGVKTGPLSTIGSCFRTSFPFLLRGTESMKAIVAGTAPGEPEVPTNLAKLRQDHCYDVG